MFPLKSLCLLKVSQLDMSKIGIIPTTLRVELEKMKVFNGNWFNCHGDASYEKKTVLSIQYMGEGSWAFQIRYAATTREDREELFDFVLKEDEPNKIGFSICKGLSGLGPVSISTKVDDDKQAVFTELTVDKNHPSKLVFKTKKKLSKTVKVVYTSKFQIDLDSDDSRVVTHGFFIGGRKGAQVTRELEIGMVECEGECGEK